ncbi:Laminin-like protein epi-1 [Lentinula edodes]|uniref:Laminin-like protein epi-1 n=1 Tax=Lentinula edodes TaxID=5353 RepID=A0A1Q3EFQ5_LENED|nr:Laminin-like protein epi-1 [Lentinula edodes]
MAEVDVLSATSASDKDLDYVEGNIDQGSETASEAPAESVMSEPVEKLDEQESVENGLVQHDIPPEVPVPIPTHADVTSEHEAESPKGAEKHNSAAGVNPKAVTPVKSGVGKSNGSTAVKKIPNSATGAGAAKVAAKASLPSSTRPAATNVVKKSTSASAASNATAKPTMSKPAPPPSRRASLAPSSKPPAVRSALSSSVNTKPPTASATSAPRASIASPTNGDAKTSAAARPRASVSDVAAKRSSITSRQSLSSSTAAKPVAPSAAAPKAASRTASVSHTKPSKSSPSISSIREVRGEDGKVIEDLQNKLKESGEALKTKADRISDLEGQIGHLGASLEAAKAEAEAKDVILSELEGSKTALEAQLKEARETLSKLQTEQEEAVSKLAAVQEELENARSSLVLQQELVQTLQEQIQTQGNDLALLKVNVSQSAEDSQAASLEHEALLKAQADFSAIQEETAALKVAHNTALEEVLAKSHAVEEGLKEKTISFEALVAQIAEMKAEKEENANKVSELEIEILELKESQETAEDERSTFALKIQALEEELAKAHAAAQGIEDDYKAKEAESSARAEQISASHENAVQAATQAQAELVTQLETLKAALNEAKADNEHARAEASASTDAHSAALQEAEQNYLNKQSEMSAEIQRITAELEGQEAKYNAKVDDVKAEHDKLLQEAFERAKSEANHDSTVESLRAEHAEILETQSKSFEKQISKLSLELKATQDDLAKSKAALEASKTEIENLTNQRDAARAAGEASPDPSSELSAEVTRLAQELSNSKDDLSAVTDQLNLTKESIVAMTANHAAELEEAAKARAEETTKLRSAHDAEISLIVTQKSEMSMQISDLQGELATVKATLEAEPAAPKGNGSVPQSPGVSREELQRMHEAHNLKMNDLIAQHEKEMKVIKEERDNSLQSAREADERCSAKAMELHLLESESEENGDEITRLKEYIDQLNEEMKKLKDGC